MPLDLEEPPSSKPLALGYKVRVAFTMLITVLICAVMVFAAYSQGWVKYVIALAKPLHQP